MMSDVSDKLRNLLGKLASEVDNTHAGAEDDQFSIMDLFIQLRKAAAKDPSLTAFQKLANEASEIAVNLVEAGGALTQEQIEDLKRRLGELERHRSEAFSAATPLAGIVPSALPAEIQASVDFENDGDILREYLNQAPEYLADIEQGVVALGEKPDDARVLDKVLRAFHSFKGGASFLNLIPVGNLSHTFESLLKVARNKELIIDCKAGELILEAGEVLKEFMAELRAQLNGEKSRSPFVLPTEGLKARAEILIRGCASAAPTAPQSLEGTRTGTVVVVPVKRTVLAPSGVAVKSPAAPKVGAPASSAPVSVEETLRLESSGPPTGGETGVRVDAQTLDAFADLVSELVIAQSFVLEHPALTAIRDDSFTRGVSQLSVVASELQRLANTLPKTGS